jgi:hypothetical protein
MALTVQFELTGSGWMDIHLTRDGQSSHLAGLSYLSPVLDDVVLAAIRMAIGESSADALFYLEPGALRLRFDQRWDEESGGTECFVSVALTPCEPMLEDVPDDAFTLDWEVKVDGPDEIAAAVLAGAKALEAKHGHAGYAEEWVEHAFPVRAVAALEAALGTQPLPPPLAD